VVSLWLIRIVLHARTVKSRGCGQSGNWHRARAG